MIFIWFKFNFRLVFKKRPYVQQRKNYINNKNLLAESVGLLFSCCYGVERSFCLIFKTLHRDLCSLRHLSCSLPRSLPEAWCAGARVADEGVGGATTGGDTGCRAGCRRHGTGLGAVVAAVDASSSSLDKLQIFL